jgi:ferredoxin
LLTTDEWGYPLVTGDQRDPDVPTALRKHARRAVKACPLQALRLVD